jgi:hypothetical protein
MPSPVADSIPVFKKGDALTHGQLNAIAEPARRTVLQPGSFQSANFNVQRRMGAFRGASLIEVALTEPVPAATWDAETAVRTQQNITAPIFENDTFDPANTTSFTNGLATAAAIAAGKFRIGYVLDERLIVVDCAELDLPE